MTTNIQLEEAAAKLNFKTFRGIFMRDEISKMKVNDYECGILNLDLSENSGTHWVAWYKDNNNKIYFDSFGIQPPKEIIKYLRSPILYNTFQIQQFNDSNCGEWCLYVLNKLNMGENYVDIILEVVNKHRLY